MRCWKTKIVLHQQSIHHKDTKIQNTVLKDAVDHSECSLCAAKICTTHLVYLDLGLHSFVWGCYRTRCIVRALEVKITKRAACCMLFTKCKFGVFPSGLKIQICAHGLDIWPVLWARQVCLGGHIIANREAETLQSKMCLCTQAWKFGHFGKKSVSKSDLKLPVGVTKFHQCALAWTCKPVKTWPKHFFQR